MKRRPHAHLTLAAGALLCLTACELDNPLKKPAPAKAAASAPRAAVEPAAIEKPKIEKLEKAPAINAVDRAALAKRIAAERIAAQKKEAAAAESAPAGPRIKSSSITKLDPDPAATAKVVPKAEDLARYTSDLAGKGALVATIGTTMGDFQCELYEEVAPVTVANFVGLARGLKAWTDPKTQKPVVGEPLYQDILFHRVIPNFMLQAGDPLGVGRGGPGYRIPDEFDKSAKHDTPGILSMANSGPNTGGSQFFITEVPTPHLDGKHTVFGKCNNAELVKKIARVPVTGSRPNTPVKIKQISISRK